MIGVHILRTFICASLIPGSSNAEFTTEVPTTWNNNDDSGSVTIDNSHLLLPDEIHIDLSEVLLDVKDPSLHLVKKPGDVEQVQVITRHRGRERNWKMKKHQHFSVYSDPGSHASFSVSVDDRDHTRMMMFGSFAVDSSAYTVSPLSHSFVHGHVVSINGSLHVITKEEHATDERIRFDTLGERSGYYEYEYLDGYNYILTELEFGINNEMFMRRRGKQNLTVELLVVLDYSIYKKWLDHSRGNADAAISGLRFYYAHIVNGMNDRYESIEHPEFRISIKPAGYYIARTRSDAPFTEDSHVKMNVSAVQAYKALDSFYKWILKRVKSHRGGDLPRFDASALFTEYTLLATDNGSRSISGLADIGAICKINAVSINKDFGQYGTIDTATHELGHNLGALHDGSNNTCTSNDQFIMASSPFATHESLFFNPYQFSSCSVRYFKDHFAQLNRLGKNCLLDGGSQEDEHEKHLKQLPGQKFSLDEQCRLLYGRESFYCGGGGEHGRSICRSVFCWKPTVKTCLTDVRLRAADGTPCSNKSWCVRSRCVWDDRAPEIDAFCPYGDYKDRIPFWNTGQTDCKSIGKQLPHLCYHTYYENLCCETCGNLKKPEEVGCEYGDRNKTACELIPLNYCYDTNMKQECCETCALRELKGGDPECKFGDKVTWCSNPSHFKSSGCYREGDKKLCCKTCQDSLSGPPGCEYGDRGDGCKKDHCHSDSHRLYCCRTCQEYGITFSLSNTTAVSATTSKPLFASFIATSECSKDSASWCTRIKPYECYRSNKTCCQTCQQYFDPSKERCEYGDRKDSCSPDKCSRGKWYLDNCCKSCASETAHTTTPTTTTHPATSSSTATTTTTTTTKPPTTTTAAATTTTVAKTTTNSKCSRGDLASWCTRIQPHECYRTNHICCSTCLQFTDESSKNCLYGDRRADCKPSYCSGYLKHDCCKTCSNMATTTSTTKSNAILETLPVNMGHCRKDKLAWCPQLSAHECYLYFADCCDTCIKHYNESNKGCEFGDREAMCVSSACRDISYSKICCKTCAADKPAFGQIKLSPTSATTRALPTTTLITTTTKMTSTTPTTTTTRTTTTRKTSTTPTATTTPHPKCPRGDLASWCSGIKSYDCYGSAHICCLSCLKYLDESSRECRYGDRRIHCDASKCDRIYAYYCCRTCSNTTSTTSTTTTKATPTRTKTTATLKITSTTALKTSTKKIDSIVPSRNNVLDEGDIRQHCPNGDLASWCSSIKPYDCYKSSKICCSTCQKYYDKSAVDDDCEYGDKVSWCESFVKKSSEECRKPTSNVATKCCKSCKDAFGNDPEYLMKFSYVRPSCSHGDEASFCRNLEPSGCYTHYKTCCLACSSFYDSTIPECPYGDKVNWCKTHATSPESCSRKDIASRCCHTCFYLTSPGNFTQSVSGCDDIAEWCRNIVGRQCYQPRAEFTCCDTCRKLRKHRIGECRYGDHVSWCEPQFCSSHPEECCETCA